MHQLLRQSLGITAITSLLFAQGQYPGPYPPDKNTGAYPPAQQQPLSPPPVMRVCASPRNPNLCGTWIWKGSYYRAWHEVKGSHSMVTIGSFTRESVVLNRADTGAPGPNHPGAGFTQVYRGTISSDGESILDGRSHASDGSSGTFRAYWGSAMAEHPELTNEMLGTAASYAPKSCDPATFDGDGFEAAIRGSRALEVKNFRVAACWLRLGADEDNPDAEGMLAAMFYKGLAGPPDYPSAFKYAKLAADQDNYMGAEVLQLMHEKGVGGVPRNPQEAFYWKVSVTNDKEEEKLAEALRVQVNAQDAQQAQMRRQQNQAAAGLLLLLGIAALGDSGPSSGSSDPTAVQSDKEKRDRLRAQGYCRVQLSGDEVCYEPR